MPPATNNHQQRSAHYVHYHATILGGKSFGGKPQTPMLPPSPKARRWSSAHTPRSLSFHTPFQHTTQCSIPLLATPSQALKMRSSNPAPSVRSFYSNLQQPIHRSSVRSFSSNLQQPIHRSSVRSSAPNLQHSTADPSIQRAIIRSDTSTSIRHAKQHSTTVTNLP